MASGIPKMSSFHSFSGRPGRCPYIFAHFFAKVDLSQTFLSVVAKDLLGNLYQFPGGVGKIAVLVVGSYKAVEKRGFPDREVDGLACGVAVVNTKLGGKGNTHPLGGQIDVAVNVGGAQYFRLEPVFLKKTVAQGRQPGGAQLQNEQLVL